jgi:hypothetical protein
MESEHIENIENKENVYQIRTSWVTEHVSKIIIGLIISSVISVAGMAINLYLNSRFIPFDEADRLIKLDVTALQRAADQAKTDHEKVLILEQVVIPMQKDIVEIKQDTRDIKNYLLK